jgi:hypothetical protein
MWVIVNRHKKSGSGVVLDFALQVQGSKTCEKIYDLGERKSGDSQFHSRRTFCLVGALSFGFITIGYSFHFRRASCKLPWSNPCHHHYRRFNFVLTIRVFFGEKQKNLQKTALEKFVHNESHKPKETIKKVNPAVTGNLASTLTQAFVILVCTRCGQNMTRAMKSCKKYNCRWCCEKGDIRFFTLRQLFGKNSDSELVEQFLRKKMQQVIYLFIILTCF